MIKAELDGTPALLMGCGG